MKDNTNHVVCNSDEPGKMIFAFENQCRILGKLPGCFVFNIFNACREPLAADFFKGRNQTVIREEVEVKQFYNNKGNLLMILGCGPGKSVDSCSTLLDVLFRQLRAIASRTGGTLIFPGELLHQPDTNIEFVTKLNQSLRLNHAGVRPSSSQPNEAPLDLAIEL